MFQGDDRNGKSVWACTNAAAPKSTMIDLTYMHADAMGVPFFYGVVEAFAIGCYCIWAWKSDWTKAPANTPFWEMVLTSYEVVDAQNRDLSEVEVSYSESEVGIVDDQRSEDGKVLTHYFNASSKQLRIPTGNENSTAMS
jgi:hypothetical protein